MNNNDNHFELEARVVAWVLGEASPFEAAELERLCAEQPELAVFKRRIEAVQGLMGEAVKPLKPPLLLSPERRAKVLAVIGGGAATIESVTAAPVKVRKKVHPWRSWALPMAACFTLMALLSAVIIPTVGSVRFSAKPKRPDPSSTVLGTDTEVRHEVPIFELASREAVPAAGNDSAPRVYLPQSFGAASSSVGSGEAGGGTTLDSRGMIGLDANAPLASPVSEARVVSLDYKVVSDDLYAGPPVGLGVSSESLQPPKSSGVSSSGITITAGTPQEFKSLVMPQGSRKLADSEIARLQQRVENESLNKTELGDFDAANSSNVRLNSVTSEVRFRKGVSDGADHFAPPAPSTPEQGYASLPGGKDGSARTDPMEKTKSLENALKQMKEQAGKIEEVSNAWQRQGLYLDAKKSNREKLDEGENAKVLERLDRIIVPSINFQGVELTKAISALTAVAEESETAYPKIIILGANESNPFVNLSLRNLSLRRVLDFLTESVGYRYEIHGDTVVVRPGNDVPLVSKPEVSLFDEAIRAEIPTATESVSTFSLHVSDASFRLAKAALERGQAPDPATIRPEEFYNAFDYGDPSPAAGEAVSCRVEQAAHPFLQQRNLVRIAMKVPAAGRGAGQPLRLTVMLDTSGSMEREDRAATVRAALTALTSLLGPDDRVTLVGFARTPRLLAESVAGDQAAKIIELAASTPAEGGTNLEEALALAGKLAMRHKLAAAQNRIVLLTDGAANLGDANPQALAKRVEALRQNGIAFDACGVVADGLDDTVLEALTRKGDGRYTVINSPEEADAGLARQLAGAFSPAAKDVKVQVHFNPARVARYRLIGFEKHRLKTEDFRNDKIDAAELAAEEAAVAVYQVEVLPEGEGELGEVAVRFLDTRTNERVERSWTLGYAPQPAAFVRATPSLQLAGSAAFLAEKLRGGALAGQVRLDEFAPVVEGLGAAYPNAPRVREFIQMFRHTRRLTGE